MTREEAKQWLEAMKSSYALPIETYEAIDMAIEALSAEAVQEAVPTVVRVTMSNGSQYYLEHERDAIQADAVDCTDFIEWLTEEVMDEEMWELNAVANGEIICRKLVKLGVLEVTEEPSYYIRPSADAVSREFYEDAVKANIKLVIENRKLKEQIESADAVPQSEQYKKGFEDAKRAYEIELARSADAVQGDECDHCVYKWGLKGGDDE